MDYHLQGLGFINVEHFRRGGGLLQLPWPVVWTYDGPGYQLVIRRPEI